MSTAVAINEDKLNAFLGKVVGDFGAALSADLVYIGQKLGLYQALAKLEVDTHLHVHKESNILVPRLRTEPFELPVGRATRR